MKHKYCGIECKSPIGGGAGNPEWGEEDKSKPVPYGVGGI